jgi:RNA polymerase-binding transcription factor DksA
MSKKQISSKVKGKKRVAVKAQAKSSHPKKPATKTKAVKFSVVTKKKTGSTKPTQSAVAKAKPKSKAKKTSSNKAAKKTSIQSKVLVKKPASKPIVSKSLSRPPKTRPIMKAGKNEDLLQSANIILKPSSQPKKIEELSPFHRKQLYKLEQLRDHILDQMQNQEQITRQRAEGSEASAFGMHQADAGSDSYDRDFALSLLSQEQDALYEIEEAIKRIFYGTYGICEMSGKEIPKARLEAIPYARFTVQCQAQIEKENKGRRRWDSNPASFMESPDLVDQDAEGANEDDESRREREQ